jgi:hypothetical protein
MKKNLKSLIKFCLAEVLTETSQIEPHDPETGVSQPSPREGTSSGLTLEHSTPQRRNIKRLIKESIVDVLKEELSKPEEPLYVEYHSQRQGENPFMFNGTKWEYVNAKYPNGKIDIGVYSFAQDLVIAYDVFQRWTRPTP